MMNPPRTIAASSRYGTPTADNQHDVLFNFGILLMPLSGLLALFADVRVAAWIRNNPFSPLFKTVLRQLRWPGHYGFTVVLAVLIVWPFRRHWRIAAALLIAGAGSSAVTAVLKYCFGRARPFRGDSAFAWHPFPGSPLDSLITRNLSFPSGDATLAFATAAVLTVAFPRLRYVALGWAVVVAITRVLQGAHYPSDVAVGAIVGIVCGSWTCRAIGLPVDNISGSKTVLANQFESTAASTERTQV